MSCAGRTVRPPTPAVLVLLLSIRQSSQYQIRVWSASRLPNKGKKRKKKTAPILPTTTTPPTYRRSFQLLRNPIAACKTADMRCSPLCSLESHTPIPTSTIWRRLRLPCAGERLPAYQLLPTCQLANSCALAAKALLPADSTGHYRYTNTQTALVTPSWAVAVPELPPGDESRTCADVGTCGP